MRCGHPENKVDLCSCDRHRRSCKKPKMTGKEKIKISEEENGDTHTLTGRNVVQVGSKRLSGVDGAVMALRVQH